MIRLYTLIHNPPEPSRRGECLIESEHIEAISAVIKALKLTDYVIENEGIAQTLVYETTFGA